VYDIYFYIYFLLAKQRKYDAINSSSSGSSSGSYSGYTSAYDNWYEIYSYDYDINFLVATQRCWI